MGVSGQHFAGAGAGAAGMTLKEPKKGETARTTAPQH